MSYFFLSDDERERKNNIEEYTKIIAEYVKNEKINLLEYSYLISYLEKSTIVNCEWFMNIINNFNDSRINCIVEKLFDMFICDKTENKIKLKYNNLTHEISKDKSELITFTSDQTTALKNIFSFLTNYKEKTYGLYGFAGTP